MQCIIIKQSYDGTELVGVHTGFMIHHTRAEKDFLNEHPLIIPVIYTPTSEIIPSPILTIINICYFVSPDKMAGAVKEIDLELNKAKDDFMVSYEINKDWILMRDEIYKIYAELELRKERLTRWSGDIEDKIREIVVSLNTILETNKTDQRDDDRIVGIQFIKDLRKGEL